MNQSHVVVPEVVPVPLSDGSFIGVKKELTSGEYFDLMVALADRQSFAKLLAYIVHWSLRGTDGQPLPYSLDMPEQARRDTVRALKVPVMREIVAAIDKHEAAEERAYEEKKRTHALSLVSNQTSVSAAL
jgi:hypothetical protein